MTCAHFSGPAAGLVLAVAAAAAAAQDAPAAAPPAAPPAAPRAELEGAVGLLLHHSPAYPGAGDHQTQVTPAGFLRWGRLSLSGAGGFTTVRRDEVERGLGLDLLRQPDVQLKLGLRFDNGRSESSSPRLAGLGDIRRTLRLRLSLRWDFDEHWRLAGGFSADALQRVGGFLVDASVARRWDLAADGELTLAAGVSGAGARYMQAWHGVTPEQAATSGLPAYRANRGLREASLSVTWRRELTPRWAGYVGLSGSRMLGGAVDSPLTEKASAWLASGALVWRF